MARKNSLERKRDRRLQKQLAAYSITAGAALALANPANASIIYSGAQNIDIDSSNPAQSIDIDGGGTGADFTFNFGVGLLYSVPFPFIKLNGANASAEVIAPLTIGNYAFVAPIPPSFLISSLAAYPNIWKSSGILNQTYLGTPFGYFAGVQDYIGIQFDISGSQHFGWIEYQGDSTVSGTILGWAYEDNPGQAIGPGAVPLPGTFGLGLLALGAAGVARFRQRKKEVKES